MYSSLSKATYILGKILNMKKVRRRLIMLAHVTRYTLTLQYVNLLHLNMTFSSGVNIYLTPI